jgi:hypothetical protein
MKPWTLLNPECRLCRTHPRAGPRDTKPADLKPADRAYGLLSVCTGCQRALLVHFGGPELADVELDFEMRSLDELYALNFVERDGVIVEREPRRRRPRRPAP